MFEAVIFDWDGTLADTKNVIIDAFQEVLKGVGSIVEDSYLEKLIGIGAKNMIMEALRTTNIPYNEETVELLLEKKNLFHARRTPGIRLFEGTIEILKFFNKKVKIALATMSNRIVIEKILKEKNIIDYFDLIVTADDVEMPKPNPEVFLKCSTDLGILPRNCIVIEDSIFGVLAAKRANMKCIAVLSGSYTEEDLKKEGPELIVNSIQEKDIIEEFVLGGLRKI